MKNKVKLPSELPTKCLEVYLSLKENLQNGATPTDVVSDIGSHSYTARISNLREFGYEIKNIRKNLYALIREPKQSLFEMNFVLDQAKKRGYVNIVKRYENVLMVVENMY